MSSVSEKLTELPRFKKASNFKAWVAGTWYPTTWISVSAWHLLPLRNPKKQMSVIKAHLPGLDSSLATLEAIASVLKFLPNGSSVEIYCSLEEAVLRLSRLALGGWQEDDLRRTDLELVKGYEIWTRILMSGRDRELDVVAVYAPPEAPTDKGLLEDLKKIAKEVATDEARRLGIVATSRRKRVLH